ncbi:VOC family protein [Streptomyces sp. AV19]|uniref:VOC family protein n=1 Tax=Streptomyces sp. AV19 TaxID=2793068 RepID=UPI0018FEA29C|nr:VOC family protein [Streptomyces sp. AV19]MBH1937291.1 VOC family protein [Streptomyces sp. AV19]MDG4536769.1 VOC family protein [Streptomyces sp. AV19]
MTRDINGLHHTSVLTRDLDGLANVYHSFGFVLSPRSRHLLSKSEGAGRDPVPTCTANRCALFGDSYIELLGIVDESAPDPWRARAVADRYEGFQAVAFETDDARSSGRRLAAAGLPASDVVELERGAATREGRRTLRARFIHLDPAATDEGRVGIAQHLTREYVHQPHYLDHPNGARGIDGVLIVADDPVFTEVVDRYARILGAPPRYEGPVAGLEMGRGRLEVVRASAAGEVLPGEPAPAPSYLAAMTIRVEDVGVARDVVERNGTATRATEDGFFVSARDTLGAGLFFTAR